MFGMVWFETVKSQAGNDFSDICYKLFSLFFILTSFVHGRELSKYLVHKIILASSVNKSIKIRNEIQNIWFSLPTYSVLQLKKECLR